MAPLQVTESRGVKVYNVSSGKTLPQWLSEKKKKSLRKDEEYKSRIELIQDLEFDVASQRLRLSRDGRFLAATGVYPPQVKVYELGELSMKFERHMDCEVVQFDILSDDYSKMVFLQADRTVELHAKFGTYYKTRVPKMGRDMVYDPVSCDLIIGGSSSDVYRLNLEQGRFLKPYSVLSEAVNCLDRSTAHGLLAMGTEVLGAAAHPCARFRARESCPLRRRDNAHACRLVTISPCAGRVRRVLGPPKPPARWGR